MVPWRSQQVPQATCKGDNEITTNGCSHCSLVDETLYHILVINRFIHIFTYGHDANAYSVCAAPTLALNRVSSTTRMRPIQER